MASHPSAEKRAKQTITRTLRNAARMGRVRSAIRNFRKAVAAGDQTKLDELLVKATQELQRAASKGVLHTRNAARRVSRLAQARHKARGETPAT